MLVTMLAQPPARTPEAEAAAKAATEKAEKAEAAKKAKAAAEAAEKAKAEAAEKAKAEEAEKAKAAAEAAEKAATEAGEGLKKPEGLENYGQTCYANSVIQLLRRMPGVGGTKFDFDVSISQTWMDVLVKAALDTGTGGQQDAGEFFSGLVREGER